MRDQAASPPDIPLSGRRAEDVPAHWLLARLGKKVLRPGGRQLTERLVGMLPLAGADVVELAPGLGLTARLVLTGHPGSYVGVEDDPDAAAIASRAVGSRGRIVVGDAKATGLPAACSDLVLGEAMLTMNTGRSKGRILDEAARILRPGGCYAVHELALVPDDIPHETAEDVRLSLVRSQKVNTRPLTTPEWRALFEAHGFTVEQVVHAPMRLLHFRRLLADEGVRGTLRIAGNYLRDREVRRRVDRMRHAFRRNEAHIAAIAIIARKPDAAGRRLTTALNEEDPMPEPSSEPVVDAREAGSTGCANLAMTAFDALNPGAGFVLVADHDPLPIHYMLEAERPSASSWENLESGPALWRARITRTT